MIFGGIFIERSVVANAANTETVSCTLDSRNGTENGFYFSVSPSDSLPSDTGWNVYYGTCIWVDGAMMPTVPVCKATSNLYYVGLIDVGLKARENETVIKIEGAITYSGKTVNFNTAYFKYNADGKWEQAGNDSQLYRYNLAEYRNGTEYTYPTKEGKVFAGWFKDSKFKKAISPTEKTGKAYAKFVDAKVASVKAQVFEGTSVNSEKTTMRFISTVDSLRYNEVGFVIEIEGREPEKVSTTTVYEKLYAVEGESVDTLLPTQFSSESALFYAYSFYNIPREAFGVNFTVIPYWVTMDGTTVYGRTAERAVENSYDATTAVDFLVEVEEGREPVVLQLTDPQVIDSAQARTENRLDNDSDVYWAPDKFEERLGVYFRETIEETNPDLILITGDLIYGEFDDNGTALTTFIDFMDSFEIPWAPVFGNHDNESAKGADWQCQQLENAQYCLFEQRNLTGNGNYTVGITQGGELKRVFFMLDSNGCSGASSASLANGHTRTEYGFGEDQIAWYTDTAKLITAVSATTKLSFAFHVQLWAFGEAYEQYGYDYYSTKNNPINIDKHASQQDGDFGYLGRTAKNPWDQSKYVWNGLLALGVDSIFVGHEHCNSASVIFEGVRLQYGQKSSTYDRANFLDANGSISGLYAGDIAGTRTPLVGGTVMTLSITDGSIQNPHIYLCGVEMDMEEGVNGLQYGIDLTGEFSSVTKDIIAGETAWKCFAGTTAQKLYINTELLKNKSTITFSVYVPVESTALVNGGEFTIRVKPDNLANKYINYSSTSADNNYKLKIGEWQTFVIDISSYGEACTQFAFQLGAGNTIYLKDIAVQ